MKKNRITKMRTCTRPPTAAKPVVRRWAGKSMERVAVELLDEYAINKGHKSFDDLERYLIDKNYNPTYVMNEAKAALFEVLEKMYELSKPIA